MSGEESMKSKIETSKLQEKEVTFSDKLLEVVKDSIKEILGCKDREDAIKQMLKGK